MADRLISVAICTFNRADSLARTLESLTVQLGNGKINWELLLIDNNSTDSTREQSESYQEKLPLRYIYEPIQG